MKTQLANTNTDISGPLYDKAPKYYQPIKIVNAN